MPLWASSEVRPAGIRVIFKALHPKPPWPAGRSHRARGRVLARVAQTTSRSKMKMPGIISQVSERLNIHHVDLRQKTVGIIDLSAGEYQISEYKLRLTSSLSGCGVVAFQGTPAFAISGPLGPRTVCKPRVTGSLDGESCSIHRPHKSTQGATK